MWLKVFWSQAFDVLPTSLLCFHRSQRTSRLVQPWASGTIFRSKYPTTDQAALCDVLSAFSHFSLTFSEGASVMLDFEGETTPMPSVSPINQYLPLRILDQK
jgi:hypothetical protein